jgi:hypothetical protein
MLCRLGPKAVRGTWAAAFEAPDDGQLARILSDGWEPYTGDGTQGAIVEGLLESHFASPVEGVPKEKALKLVMMDPGIRLPTEAFPSLRVKREITTYDALHLRLDGTARLATALIDRLGKQGELVAYDIIHAARREQDNEPRAASEFIREWTDSVRSKKPNIFTCGLEASLVKETPTEAVVHVTACEWARYFREKHPTVGYLVACSTDDAALPAINESLRMQRTSTLMEGAALCDFRMYSVERHGPSGCRTGSSCAPSGT